MINFDPPQHVPEKSTPPPLVPPITGEEPAGRPERWPPPIPEQSDEPDESEEVDVTGPKKKGPEKPSPRPTPTKHK